jgi:hypothetical protein
MKSGEQLRRYPRGRGGARVLHRADFLAQCATEAISAFCSEGGSWSGIRCKTTLVVSQKQPLRCSSRLLGRCRPTGDSNTRSTARGPRQRVCARRAARCQRGGALSAQGHRGRGQRQAATGGRGARGERGTRLNRGDGDACGQGDERDERRTREPKQGTDDTTTLVLVRWVYCSDWLQQRWGGQAELQREGRGCLLNSLKVSCASRRAQ